MIKFKLGSTDLEKWLHQNRAEVIEAEEGCLLDDLLVITKRGAAAILETYQNPNSSIYTVIFSRNPEEATNEYYNIMEGRRTA